MINDCFTAIFDACPSFLISFATISSHYVSTWLVELLHVHPSERPGREGQHQCLPCSCTTLPSRPRSSPGLDQRKALSQVFSSVIIHMLSKWQVLISELWLQNSNFDCRWLPPGGRHLTSNCCSRTWSSASWAFPGSSP